MRAGELDILSNIEAKTAVVEALVELCVDTPFDKVKVVDICKKSGVSRATFYRLFDDKFGVMQWSIRYAYWQGADQIGRTLSWYDGYYITETYIMRKADFYANAAKSNDYNALDNFAPRHRRAVLIKTVTERSGREPSSHLLFDIDTTVAMECTLFPRWHYGEYDADLETFCRWVAQNVPAQLHSMLNTPMNPKSGF